MWWATNKITIFRFFLYCSTNSGSNGAKISCTSPTAWWSCPKEKMKSREGTVVDADDLMDEMIATARETSAELGKLDGCTAEEAEEISRIVGLGALKYFILKVDPRKNMTFNPKESIDFNGNTGPFIQYTHARICSVMRKAAEAGIDYRQVDTAKVDPSEKEISLIQHLADFPAVVAEAGRIQSFAYRQLCV